MNVIWLSLSPFFGNKKSLDELDTESSLRSEHVNRLNEHLKMYLQIIHLQNPYIGNKIRTYDPVRCFLPTELSHQPLLAVIIISKYCGVSYFLNSLLNHIQPVLYRLVIGD